MRNISTLIFVFISLISFAQQKICIKGEVKNEKNNALAYADILLTTVDKNDHILSFCMSDSKGKFNLEYQTDVKEIKVIVSSMGYKKKSQLIELTGNQKEYHLSFVMNEKMQKLKEIEVRAKPKVRINKDTTIFNLKNILNGSEQVVEEIISKCPGMKLQANGKFKFKGKEVSTVLLGDDDLFGGAYTIGTKNIKAQDIKGVEAIENYTKNPLLQGVEISDKVAVRLKFKKGISIANNMELGYGHKERYYANHTGIVIAKKVKFFNLLNYNNLGINVGQQHFNPMNHLMMLGAGTFTKGTKCPTFLESSSVNSLFKAQQSDRNNAFFGSFNLVPHISKTSKIRANLNFLSDRSIQEQEFTSIITTNADDPIRIQQEEKKRYKPRYFNADIVSENYFGKNSIENILQFSKLQNTTGQTGLTNGANQMLKSYSDEFYLYNATKWVRKITDKKVFQLKAVLSFHETPEKLEVKPGIDFVNNQFQDTVSNFQDIRSQKESVKLKGYYYYQMDRYSKFNIDFGVNFHNKNLRSDLIQNTNQEVYKNQIDYKITLPFANVNYRLNYQNLEVSSKLGAQVYSYTFREQKAEEKNEMLLMNASLFVRYKLNRYNELKASATRFQTEPDERNLFTNFIMTSNRSLQNNQLSFDAITSRKLNLSYTYRDLLNDFNAGINFTYSDKDKAMQSVLTISQDVSYTNYFLSNKGMNDRSVNVHVNKFLNFMNTNLSLSSSLSINQYYNNVNSSEVRKNESSIWNSSIRLETNFIGHFIFGNGISYSKKEYHSQDRNTIKNQSLNNDVLVIYKPNDRFITRLNYRYQIPSLSQKKNDSQKLYATIQFYNKTKSMSFKIEGHNLLNQKDMDFISNTDYAITVTNKKLQERYFLFSVGFRF